MAMDSRALSSLDADTPFAVIFAQSAYWGFHLLFLLIPFLEITRSQLILCAIVVSTQLFAVTGAYHRYFAHRAYQTSRVFQFVLGFLGTMTVQKGPLWWASHHRLHHRHSDDEDDVHSPSNGFWYSHQLWIFDRKWRDTKHELVKDLAVFPELVFLNRNHMLGPIFLAVCCYLYGGFPGLYWGFCVATVISWHLTYMINSVAHMVGYQRFDTKDTSRNNPVLGLLLLGEGWHNNHHKFPGSARQGLKWWEVDITYYILLVLKHLGLIWNLRVPDLRH